MSLQCNTHNEKVKLTHKDSLQDVIPYEYACWRESLRESALFGQDRLFVNTVIDIDNYK